jgi:hypothetical protein
MWALPWYPAVVWVTGESGAAAVCVAGEVLVMIRRHREQ